MSTKLEELAIELLGLPAADRALLAKQLILSLDESGCADSERLWLEEARRRSKEICEGTVEGVPAQDAFLRARRQLQ